MNKAYDKVTWQNAPSSTATPLNASNLNKMSDALDTIDDRVITLDGQASSASSAITALQEGKVDKVVGKGLSTNDYDNTAKGIVDGVTSALAEKVDKEAGKGLSTEDFTTAEKTKLAGISAEATKTSISDVLEDGDTIANITIDGTVTPIKVEVDDELSLDSENSVQNKVITGALNNKLDTDGVAEGANMLTINTPVSDDTPYVYREIPVKNAFRENLKKIIGASVVWNQLAKADKPTTTFAGVTFTNNSDGSWTLTGTPDRDNSFYNLTTPQYGDLTIKPNHVYYMSSKSNKDRVGFSIQSENASGFQTAYVYTYDIIYKAPDFTVIENTRTWARLQVSNYTNVDIGTVKVTPQIFDLTAMFGSTIAEYVNTLETATAGSGIAWLQKYGFFTEEYYVYSANTVQSVSVSGHKVVGFNQWDEQTRNGYYNTSGVFVSANTNIANKNMIPVKEGETYYFKCNSGNFGRICRYDKNGDFISSSVVQQSSFIYTIPYGVAFLNFDMVGAYGTTYKNDICINISNASLNGQYKPYHTETTALDHTILRGIFKLDANNNLYADGDIYNADGSGSVVMGEIDMGDINWTYNESSSQFRGALTNCKMPANVSVKVASLSSSNYADVTYNQLTTSDMAYAITSTTVRGIALKDSNYTDATTFKTAISGKKLLYILDTPTTASLTPFNPISAIENGGTEEFIDYQVAQETRDVAIPCGQETDFTQAVEITSLPADDGTYTMKLVKSASGSTINFVADT